MINFTDNSLEITGFLDVRGKEAQKTNGNREDGGERRDGIQGFQNWCEKRSCCQRLG